MSSVCPGDTDVLQILEIFCRRQSDQYNTNFHKNLHIHEAGDETSRSKAGEAMGQKYVPAVTPRIKQDQRQRQA